MKIKMIGSAIRGGSKNLKKYLFIFLCCMAIYLLFSSITSNLQQSKKQIINLEDIIQLPVQGKDEGKNISARHQHRVPHPDLQMGEEYPNCGVRKKCAGNEFPVYLHTGLDDSDEPKLCVNGRYVLKKGLNGGGRGLNVAIIDPATKQVLRAASFDTFQSDSITLEVFLLSRSKGDIIILFTHDDAVMKLSDIARKVIAELGSSSIDVLKFRGTWYLITQKGISGYTPFEKLSNPPNGRAWGKALEEYVCVPTTIEGSTTKTDTEVPVNAKKRKFCSDNLGYGEFCEVSTLDEVTKPAGAVSGGLNADDPIFSIPIIMLAGLSHHSLPMTLESIIQQPGIKTNMVTVFYLPVFNEAADLAGLFQLNAQPLKGVTSYKEQVEAALNWTVGKYPDKDFVIVIDEEIILSPDFLQYMSQLLPAIKSDSSILSVSAWNDNGFEGTSSDISAAYRVEGFPGLGYMIRTSTYTKVLKKEMEKCCRNRPWDNWILPDGESKSYMLIPDVSRIHHGEYEGLGPNAKALEALFNRPRFTSIERTSKLVGVQHVMSSVEYDQFLQAKIKEAVALRMSREQIEKCTTDTIRGSSAMTEGLVVYFLDDGMDGTESVISKLCKCFGLFHAPGVPPRGLYKGVLRSTFQGHGLYLVSSKSDFYKLKPVELIPVGMQ